MNYFVSISCITFNHKYFIKKCLEGILSQKTNFDFEVVIHDDASTDGTKEIIVEYQKKYPDIIFPYYQTENQYSKGVRGFMAKYNFPRCRGKYIALCEGDDYWTDPYKLQKQIDFLEANPDYSLVFHKVKALQKNNLYDDLEIERRYEKIVDKSNITTIDLLKNGNFIHTCSVVFRNNDPVIPKEIFYSTVGDYIIFIALSHCGSIKRLDDYMAVYRRGTGTYSSLSPVDMRKKMVEYHLCILSFLTEEKERLCFLEKCLDLIKTYEKAMLSNSNIALKKSFFDIVKISIRKTKVLSFSLKKSS